MTYLAACTVATLLLAVFISASFFMHLVREKQHKRHLREQAELLDELERQGRMLRASVADGVETEFGLKRVKAECVSTVSELLALEHEATRRANDLQQCNLAGQRLDETMRRTIGEGIDLARVLDAGNMRFCELVAARQEQRAHEDTTLLQWAKIRDDLEAFAASYPSYMFQSDSETRGQG